MPDWLEALLRVLAFVAAALVVGAIAFLVVRLIVGFVRALRMPEVEPDPTADWERVAAERLSDAVDSGLDQMASGSPGDAVIACWVALEAAAATAGISRLPAETPSEFTVRVLALGNVSGSALSELAELYREARFSSHRRNRVRPDQGPRGARPAARRAGGGPPDGSGG